MICSGVMVILPPSRMLAVAKSFTTLAPSAFIFGDFFAIVGQNAGTSLERGDGKEAEPMNARGAHTHPSQAAALGPVRGYCCW